MGAVDHRPGQGRVQAEAPVLVVRVLVEHGQAGGVGVPEQRRVHLLPGPAPEGDGPVDDRVGNGLGRVGVQVHEHRGRPLGQVRPDRSGEAAAGPTIGIPGEHAVEVAAVSRHLATLRRQAGGVERMIGTFPSQKATGHVVEFGVDDVPQFRHSCASATLDVEQDLRGVVEFAIG